MARAELSDGGSDGRRSRDLTIFSRALYQLSYRASETCSDEKSPFEKRLNLRDPDRT